MTSTKPLRVAVFGASGKIGRLVVEQLLAAGHAVTAYARNPGKLALSGPKLTLVKGELSDTAAIAHAVEGVDAVVSALGPALGRGASGTPVADGTRAIVHAMQAAGVRRFVGLATPSVADPRDTPTFTGWLLPRVAGLTMPNAMRELVGMTEAVTASDLAWTIARITNPTDSRAKQTVRSGFLGRDKVGWTMSRVDIADFLVRQLFDDTYVRAAPAISN